MKKIFFLTMLIGFGTIGSLRAQFTGKKFMDGNAFINFKQDNDAQDNTTNEYGYNFDISLGKFKTETRASGWTISSLLSGGKRNYSVFDNGNNLNVEKTGLSSVGFGVGHFWQFYKHFNEHVGIFGGPSVNLGYSNSKNFSGNDGYLQKSEVNNFSLGLNLRAGVYYNLSEKWWLTASVAFANPIAVSYQNVTYSLPPQMEGNMKTNRLEYKLTPTFTFPSVGLGVRYFYGR